MDVPSITQTSMTLLEQMRGVVNERAWHEFMRRYSPMILAFCKRLGLSDSDALDALQETVIAVSEDFRTMDAPFDRSKGRFKSWLRGVARNKALSINRKSKPRRGFVAESNDEPGADLAALPDVAGQDEIESLWEIEWRRNLLRLAMEQITGEFEPATVHAFILLVVDGWPVERVAAMMHRRPNAIYIAKHRILSRLREVVDELVEAEG
ncbi:MAG: sigma-70 family RNA polymerase sigma factor [Phycisphaerae bacterium]